MQQSRGRKWVLVYALTFFLSIGSLVSGFYIYDPLMLFHLPINRDVTFVSDMRAQASGIIQNLNYDSYIVGTSMMENTSADSAGTILGGDFANISMSGGDYVERKLVLDFALAHGVKKIIYSLDDMYLTQRGGSPDYPIHSFDYLYSASPLKIKFYFQRKFIKCLLSWSVKSKCVGGASSLDMPNNWLSTQPSRFGGLNNWLSAASNPQIREALNEIVLASQKVADGKYNLLGVRELEEIITNSYQYIEVNLISLARKHPNTIFHLVFPPYSRIRYSLWHQLDGTGAKVHEAIVRYLVLSAAELENVFVHGYEDQDFPDDISNYKDTRHYNVWVNELMLKDFDTGQRVISPESVDEYLKIARLKAEGYDLVGLGEEINRYLVKM